MHVTPFNLLVLISCEPSSFLLTLIFFFHAMLAFFLVTNMWMLYVNNQQLLLQLGTRSGSSTCQETASTATATARTGSLHRATGRPQGQIGWCASRATAPSGWRRLWCSMWGRRPRASGAAGSWTSTAFPMARPIGTKRLGNSPLY